MFYLHPRQLYSELVGPLCSSFRLKSKSILERDVFVDTVVHFLNAIGKSKGKEMTRQYALEALNCYRDILGPILCEIELIDSTMACSFEDKARQIFIICCHL